MISFSITPQDLTGQVVARATNGPFCHVAIDLGDGTKIEADWTGVVRNADNKRAVAATFNTKPHAPQLADGIAWLKKQIGDPYGKEDIVNQVLRLMGIKVYIAAPKNYDCSDLAADFLVHAGAGKLLGKFEDNLHLVTPNDLARVLGVKAELTGVITVR